MMFRTQIQLTEKQIEALKSLAAHRHLSVAELIRQCVDSMLSSSLDPRERKERAIAAAGRFRSGKPDLSTRHDQYLAEAFN